MLLFNKLNYDIVQMQTFHDDYINKLNFDKKKMRIIIYGNLYMMAMKDFFFIYGYRGIDKNFFMANIFI